MQAAFQECHGLQCGFCTPGMVMSRGALLKDNPGASEPEIREASKATSAAAPAITTSSRRSSFARAARSVPPPENEETHDDRHVQLTHRQAACCAARTRASSPARASTPTTWCCPARPTPASCARRTRTRASESIDTARAAKAPGRARHLHRRRPCRGQGRRPALRLADPQQGRHADEGAAAPGAGAGQGAPCRRPGRAGGGRDVPARPRTLPS